MSDSQITRQQPDPQDWTVNDLQQQVARLRGLLSGANERIDGQISQLSEWADGLPPHHAPVPDPVRLADLAQTDQRSPLSLARRVRELTRLLERADALGQTLMAAVAADSPSFAPQEAAVGTGPVDSALPALEEDEVSQRRVSLIGRCSSAWGDDEVFERQRQAVRRVMAFDGNRTWYGTLSASISDDVAGWQDVMNAAEAGAYVEIQAVRDGKPNPVGDLE